MSTTNEKVWHVLDVAGVRLRLVLSAPELGAELRRRFPLGQTNAPAADALRDHDVIVHVFASDTNRPLPHSAVSLDGQGEYHGRFSPDEQRAWVVLNDNHPLSALENFLRQLLRRFLLPADALVLHAACVECLDGEAVVFAGRSGAGKTTVCRLSEGRCILSDDQTVLRLDGDYVLAWGLPSTGHFPHSQVIPGPVPVRAMTRLVQAPTTKLIPLRPSLAIAQLMAAPAEHRGESQTAHVMQLLEQITRCIPCSELHFTRTPDFWRLFERAALPP